MDRKKSRNISVITWGDWRRKGFHYEAKIEYFVENYHGTIILSHDFFTHQLLKFLHGREGLLKIIADRIERVKRENINGQT